MCALVSPQRREEIIFLQGLLVILRDAGYRGLIFVLDEVETLQRVRSDVRDKGLK